jgi:glycosyltransferase involved in cell wall biosynthesis
MSCSKSQADFLARYLDLSPDRTCFVWDHTDTSFFCPGPAQKKERATIVSVGLEQRDYRTLAHATESMNVDVCISGFSRDSATSRRAFPETLPSNMSRRFYDWSDLAQLYRDAAIVVVSVFENNYAAGVQGLMEGMASGRPVVVTATEGLSN